MATYTFTVSTSYNLGTHHIVFVGKRLQVFITSTSEKIYDEDFSAGLAFRCQNNDFQIGTLTASVVFTNSVNISNRAAKLWLNEVSNNNEFVGSDNLGDPGIYHQYKINSCPVQLSATGSTVFIKCPCESESGPCENTCYTYGN